MVFVESVVKKCVIYACYSRADCRSTRTQISTPYEHGAFFSCHTGAAHHRIYSLNTLYVNLAEEYTQQPNVYDLYQAVPFKWASPAPMPTPPEPPSCHPACSWNVLYSIRSAPAINQVHLENHTLGKSTRRHPFLSLDPFRWPQPQRQIDPADLRPDLNTHTLLLLCLTRRKSGLLLLWRTFDGTIFSRRRGRYCGRSKLDEGVVVTQLANLGPLFVL